MFEATTQKIRVQVQPAYVSDQSDPKENYYFFSYKVTISNEGDSEVQLISRHWVIKDAYGEMEEVVGDGVVGVQPTLKPGESFEYSSFCPLATPTGSMTGSYTMQSKAGQKIKVDIPTFILSEPTHYH